MDNYYNKIFGYYNMSQIWTTLTNLVILVLELTGEQNKIFEIKSLVSEKSL